MASRGVRCPYCTAINPARTTQRTTSLDWTLRFVNRRSATTQEGQSIHVKCILCGAEYDLFTVEDTSWLSQHLSVSDTALQDIKTIYSVRNVNLDEVFGSVSVLTRPSKHTIHMFFELYGIRSFMNCQQRGKTLIGISVEDMR